MTSRTTEGAATPAPEDVGMPPWRLARFLVKLTLRHPVLLAIALAASAGVATAGILSIGLVVPFLDSLGGGSLALAEQTPLGFLAPLFEGMDTTTKVRAIAGLLVAIAVARGGLVYLESRISAYLRILIERDIRQLVFDDLLRVELGYIHGERTANLHTLLHRYPRQAADIVDQYLSALTKGMTTLTYVLGLLALSVPLTLIALGLGLLSMLSVEHLNRAVKRNARRTNALRVNLQQTSLEALNGMKLIRLFARERQARDRFLSDVRAMQMQAFRGASLASAIPPVQSFVNTLLFAALILAATLLLPQNAGAAWLLNLSLFLVIMVRLISPLQSFSKKRARITQELPALEEIVRFLEARKPYLADGARPFQRLATGVRFERVTFAYDASDGPAVSDASFEIPRGATVAIVGASGSGKSTVIHLLARMADPQRGRILVDGVDLRELDSVAWRRRLAFVSQDNFLFNDTVRNNIRFARPEASDAEVERAARLAHAHDFILQLDHGYDTLVGERGVRLSGGQIQRIAIARAVLADPDILVLDEATSALDTATERAVQDAIEAVARERTVVAIAHRLSTIRRADHILVLEQGRVVEQGTHEELLGLQGHYWRYVQLQDMGASDPGSAVPAQRPVDVAASDGIDATAPAATGPREARRVPVEVAPLRPARVVLAAGHARAHVVLDDGRRVQVATTVARQGASAADAMRAHVGECVAVAAGDDRALVRLGDQVTADIPLYVVDGEGREVRARVREVHLPGQGLLRNLARRG